MGKGNGSVTLETQIGMRGSIKMIRNGATESLLGRVATFSREITKQISEMEWARCIG